MMTWYPWLDKSYLPIISYYRQNKGHHALLIHSKKGNGVDALLYALSCWLICCDPHGVANCTSCYSCQLMNAGNHPDYYCLPENKQSYIGIESIRRLIDKLHERSHQGGAKVVRLAYVECLTEQAVNALLKILEEPPSDTYFLLNCYEYSRLLPTVLSRCLYWLLSSPEEKVGLQWLREMGVNSSLSSLRTALRLCNGGPLAAQEMLLSDLWNFRLKICVILRKAIINNDFLILLPFLKMDNGYKYVSWLLSLFIDTLKFQAGIKNFLVNLDQMELINFLSTHWSAIKLHNQLQQWLKCLYYWCNINNIDRELLLVYQLLNCELKVIDSYDNILDM